LVAAQDGGVSVATSRQKVATDNRISQNQVEEIEEEVLKAQWLPLDREHVCRARRHGTRTPGAGGPPTR
jgi:hypothetical protein